MRCKLWCRTLSNEIIGEWSQTTQHTDQLMELLRPLIAGKKITWRNCVSVLYLHFCNAKTTTQHRLSLSIKYLSTLCTVLSASFWLSVRQRSHACSVKSWVPFLWRHHVLTWKYKVKGSWFLLTKRSKCGMRSFYLPCNNESVWDQNW